VAYSDATKQVLALALDRLATDPSFPPLVLERLRQLVETGTFGDAEKILAEIERPAETDRGGSRGD